jgi:hypothetical protein
MTGNPKQQVATSFSIISVIDTLPEICTVLPAGEIAGLSPFTISLSNSYKEEPLDGYSGCIYEFFKSPDFGTIKISLIKSKSKADAMTIYNNDVADHISLYQISPEPIPGLADSAHFNYNAGDISKCDDCDLSLLIGLYNVVVSFHGQYDDVSRDKKKKAAISIVKLLYNRIPGIIGTK